MAGLSAAWELVGAGQGELAVTILEASDRVGGKLRQEVVGGHLVDVGAESILGLRPEATDLIEEIGALPEMVVPGTTSASIRSHGALHPLPPGTLMGVPADPRVAAGLLSESEIARACAEGIGAPVTADCSVGDFLAARLGDALVDRMVEPLLGGVYAGQARHLSLAATMPGLYAAACSGGSVLELAARALGGGGAGPRRPPFVGIRGGVGRLPQLLADAVIARGVEIRCDVAVTNVQRTSSGAWTVEVETPSGSEQIPANAVIVTSPRTVTRDLLAALCPVASAELGEIDLASVGLVTFAFAADVAPALSGSGFLVPPVEELSVKASTFSSTKWPWLAEHAPGIVYLRASFGRHLEDAPLALPDAELIALARADLGVVLGVELPDPLDVHVQRWVDALPQYSVGHLERVARLRADIATVPGLEVAGAAYDGVGIPAVIASARRAAIATREYLTTKGTIDV